MGRISTIKRMPPELREAMDQLLREGRYTIAEIVEHVRLLGAPVSHSAVGRYKKRFDKQLARVREAQDVAAVWVTKLGENPRGDVGQMVAEMLKTTAFRTLADVGDDDAAPTPSEISLLARAMKDLEGAQKANVEYRTKLRALWQAELAERAEAAKTEVAALRKRNGLSDETMRAMRNILEGMVG